MRTRKQAHRKICNNKGTCELRLISPCSTVEHLLSIKASQPRIFFQAFEFNKPLIHSANYKYMYGRTTKPKHYLKKKKKMEGDGVKLLGMWVSPFVHRIKLALKLKGIEYEYIEEDLVNKSERLLKYNPIHKKVPVLLHGDKPLTESLIILEYIDETWKDNYPLLPEDPYERAMARFWAKYTDEKPWLTIIGAFAKTTEEQMKTLKEAQESLKPLEELLEGKRFFGGETIGYLDIVIGWIAFLVPAYEELLGLTYVDPNSMPLLHAWCQEFTNVPLVKEGLPPREKLLPYLKVIREKLMSSSSTYP